jgi:diguanylate cyclase (GGDEF)-like protein
MIPDAVILDLKLPGINGFRICEQLRLEPQTRAIPIIVVSGSWKDSQDRIRSIEVGADDFLTKPFDAEELIARIKRMLQRKKVDMGHNPLTGLPGNLAIEEEARRRLARKDPLAFAYIDLDNFKAYNDKYGFSNGDKVIRLASQIIIKVVQQLSPQDHFIGHIGGDDFIFICDYEKANEICQAITEGFDSEIPKYYNEEDRKKGFIVVEDRRGVISQFPIVSIAVGMASDEGNKFSNLGQINHSLTQLKKIRQII